MTVNSTKEFKINYESVFPNVQISRKASEGIIVSQNTTVYLKVSVNTDGRIELTQIPGMVTPLINKSRAGKRARLMFAEALGENVVPATWFPSQDVKVLYVDFESIMECTEDVVTVMQQFVG